MNSAVLCMGCMRDLQSQPICPYCGRDVNEPAASPLHLPPRTLLHEQYLLGRVLGHGGFGVTYLGWDLNLARRVAVKEYLPGGISVRNTSSRGITPYSGKAEAFQWGLEKFLEEARVLARFQNQPGIVAVLNFFRENETAYLVMEYLEGVTLQEYLGWNQGKIEPAVALRVMEPVMDALVEVHKAGILHRDVSPDNIYVCNTGQIKVLDFGAARYALSQQSQSMSIILKEGYAPEEQYRSKGKQGPWTDVYATAATFYRAITGIIPPPSLDRREVDELIPPRQVGAPISQELETILSRGLAIRAADRYGSMEDFRTAIALAPDRAADVHSFGNAIAGALSTRYVPASSHVEAAETRPVAIPARSQAAVSDGETRPVAALMGDVTRAVPNFPPTPYRPPSPPPPPPPPLPPPPPPASRKSTGIRPKWLPLVAGCALLSAGGIYLARPGKHASGISIKSFQAANSRIERGQSAILSWEVQGDGDAILDPGGKAVPLKGHLEVQPQETTTYALSVRNKVSIDARQVTIEVAEPSQQPKDTASDTGSNPQSPDGAPPLSEPPPSLQEPPASRPTGPSGAPRRKRGASASDTAPQYAPNVPGPGQGSSSIQITAFQADPPEAVPGQPVTLRWSVQGADSVVIQPQIGSVPPSDSRQVVLQSSTAFTLRATGAGLPAHSALMVRVLASGNPNLPRRYASNANGTNTSPSNPSLSGAMPPTVFRVTVIHDHDNAMGAVGSAIGGAFGRLGRRQPQNPGANSCTGQLAIVGSTLRFTSNVGDGFNTSLSNVSDVGMNRLAIQNRAAFHVHLANGSKYNFVPLSNGAAAAVSAIRSAVRQQVH